jgi:hypothetical protein
MVVGIQNSDVLLVDAAVVLSNVRRQVGGVMEQIRLVLKEK